MSKGYEGKSAEFAKGGGTLGRTKDFMKTEDRFRGKPWPDTVKTDDSFAKDGAGSKTSGTFDNTGPGHGKSLTPVKPQS